MTSYFPVTIIVIIVNTTLERNQEGEMLYAGKRKGSQPQVASKQ
jgi:hypothetical protein